MGMVSALAGVQSQTRLFRWRESATSLKPRQRSEISLSLDKVLVISANVRSLALKVLAKASAAALRLAPSRSCNRLSVGSIASSLAETLKRRDEMVWSNSRFQAAYPLWDFS